MALGLLHCHSLGGLHDQTPLNETGQRKPALVINLLYLSKRIMLAFRHQIAHLRVVTLHLSEAYQTAVNCKALSRVAQLRHCKPLVDWNRLCKVLSLRAVVKKNLSSGKLIKHASQAPHVNLVVEVRQENYLRRSIRQGLHCVVLVIFVNEQRASKINELYLVLKLVRKKNVLGLNVCMDDFLILEQKQGCYQISSHHLN